MFFSLKRILWILRILKHKVGFDCLIGSSFVYAEFGLADIYVQKKLP